MLKASALSWQLDVRSLYFTQNYGKAVLGMPQMPLNMIKEHMAKVKDGRLPSIVSSDLKGERAELMHNAILERLEDGSRFPRGGVFVMHGRDDTIVPIEGS
ncbi:unnamed protein product [Clonostachys byssicola]|uniref:Uncharacterized protein n=1 Tax=Clonostachys byssicola TaxID=160290 RepID=A0A9N9U720_9HYPO|nr:unnamed protein product [Clonostachys byssicola]